MLLNILKGISVGFSLAAPGDKIAALCIKETEKDGLNLGLAAGLGASSADFCYGILTAFVLHLFQLIIIGHETFFTLFSAGFLLYLGINKIKNAPFLDKIHTIEDSFLIVYTKTFLLTLTNLSTVLEFLATFIGLEIDITHYRELLVFVAAVFVGAALWWVSLCLIAEFISRKTCLKFLRYINYGAGLLLFAFAVYTFSNLFI